MGGLLAAFRAVREHGLDKVHVCAGCQGSFELRDLTRYAAAYWCAPCSVDAIDGLW